MSLVYLKTITGGSINVFLSVSAYIQREKHKQVENKNLELSFILIFLVTAWQCRFVSTTLFLLVETFTPPYHLSARTIRKKNLLWHCWSKTVSLVDERSCKIIIKEILHFWIQGFWKLFNKHQTHAKLQRKKYAYSNIKQIEMNWKYNCILFRVQ